MVVGFLCVCVWGGGCCGFCGGGGGGGLLPFKTLSL